MAKWRRCFALLCFMVLFVYSAPTYAAKTPTLSTGKTYDFKKATIRITSVEKDGTILYRSSLNGKNYFGALRSGTKLWEFQAPSEYPILSYSNGSTFYYDISDSIAIKVISSNGNTKQFVLEEAQYDIPDDPSVYGRVDELGNYHFHLKHDDTDLHVEFVFNASAQLLWTLDRREETVSTTSDKSGIYWLDTELGMLKLNPINGQQIWTAPMPVPDESDIIYNDLDTLYILHPNPSGHELVSYNSFGKQLWSVELLSPPSRYYGLYNITVTKQFLYFWDTDGYMNALERRTGKIIWSTEFSDPGANDDPSETPILEFNIFDDTTIAVTYDTGIFSERIAIFNRSGTIIYNKNSSLRSFIGSMWSKAQYKIVWDSKRNTITYYSILGQRIMEYKTNNAEAVELISDFSFVVQAGSKLTTYTVPSKDQALIKDKAAKLIKTAIGSAS